jgi:hypothetical protein
MMTSLVLTYLPPSKRLLNIGLAFSSSNDRNRLDVELRGTKSRRMNPLKASNMFYIMSASLVNTEKIMIRLVSHNIKIDMAICDRKNMPVTQKETRMNDTHCMELEELDQSCH